MTRIAIITGASSGIGAAVAELMQANDFLVLNIARRTCKITDVTNICADLNSTSTINTLTKDLDARLKQLQPSEVCLVHNAALMLKDSALDCTDNDFSHVMQINVMAINTLNRHLLPHMKSGSSIIFMGSTLSEKAVGGAFSYIVSKHAQLGMMRATCQDLMGTNIHTTLVCPGFTDTEMLRNHIGNDEKILNEISAMNSFNRLIKPDEIARLILWAHQNPVINGSVLHANLGQLER